MKEVIFAGFGGQGVLTGGLIIAYMASQKDYNATWMPAYGPTMRGGKANCTVKIGENEKERIGSPIMGKADILVAMNEPSLDYLSKSKTDAWVFVNSHAVDDDYEYPAEANVVKLDCVELAQKCKNPKGQNLVMLGAIMRKANIFDKEYAIKSMCKFFEDKGKGKFNAKNIAAFEAGYEAV